MLGFHDTRHTLFAQKKCPPLCTENAEKIVENRQICILPQFNAIKSDECQRISWNVYINRETYTQIFFSNEREFTVNMPQIVHALRKCSAIRAIWP